jgi:hypothetical protein
LRASLQSTSPWKTCAKGKIQGKQRSMVF